MTKLQTVPLHSMTCRQMQITARYLGLDEHNPKLLDYICADPSPWVRVKLHQELTRAQVESVRMNTDFLDDDALTYLSVIKKS